MYFQWQGNGAQPICVTSKTHTYAHLLLIKVCLKTTLYSLSLLLNFWFSVFYFFSPYLSLFLKTIQHFPLFFFFCQHWLFFYSPQQPWLMQVKYSKFKMSFSQTVFRDETALLFHVLRRKSWFQFAINSDVSPHCICKIEEPDIFVARLREAWLWFFFLHWH